MGKHCKDPFLGRWTRWQREKRKSGKLPPDRCEKLSRLGFHWELRHHTLGESRGWDARFEELMEFQARHSHCNVPEWGIASDWQTQILGRWVTQQRVMNRLGRLPAPRVAKLDEVGFIWDPQEADWRSHSMLLVEYIQRHGHSSVPSTSVEDTKLSQWVSQQRLAHLQACMSQS